MAVIIRRVGCWTRLVVVRVSTVCMHPKVQLECWDISRTAVLSEYWNIGVLIYRTYRVSACGMVEHQGCLSDEMSDFWLSEHWVVGLFIDWSGYFDTRPMSCRTFKIPDYWLVRVMGCRMGCQTSVVGVMRCRTNGAAEVLDCRSTGMSYCR